MNFQTNDIERLKFCARTIRERERTSVHPYIYLIQYKVFWYMTTPTHYEHDDSVCLPSIQP